MIRFNRLHCAGVAGFMALVLAACGADAPKSGAAARTADNRPNILFILADDLGYADLGAFGSEIPTPNLDALATDGMLLTDFYANMTCSPTRSMLMSGTDNHLAGLGVMSAPTRDDQKGQPGYEGYLNFRVASLADLMTDAGYNTYMIGKWHLGDAVNTGPHARGFKRVFASFDGAAHLGGWDWRGPQPAKYWDNDKVVNVGDDWYTTRDYTKKMLGFIEQDRAAGKPFFAYMAYTAPHWPLANLHALYLVLGIFIPLIVTNCIVLARVEAFAAKNSPLQSMFDGIFMGVGMLWTLSLLGGLRELIGRGTLFSGIDMVIPGLHPLQLLPADYPGFLIAMLPPGAFILLGCLIAWKNWIEARAAARQQRRPPEPVAAAGCH